MNSEFNLTQAAGCNLESAVRNNDGTIEDIEYLSTGNNFRAVTLLRMGKAKLVEVADDGSEGEIITTEPAPTTWTIDDEGNIHFVVTSNGRGCERWVEYLDSHNTPTSFRAQNALRRVAGTPTNDTIYHVVIRPTALVPHGDRFPFAEKIRASAEASGWVKPSWEVACLIAEALAEEQLDEMGLWHILTMHEPIIDSAGRRCLLNFTRRKKYRSCWWLDIRYENPDSRVFDGGGIAFVVPPASPQA